jgi:hypothetical protein
VILAEAAAADPRQRPLTILGTTAMRSSQSEQIQPTRTADETILSPSGRVFRKRKRSASHQPAQDKRQRHTYPADYHGGELTLNNNINNNTNNNTSGFSAPRPSSDRRPTSRRSQRRRHEPSQTSARTRRPRDSAANDDRQNTTATKSSERRMTSLPQGNVSFDGSGAHSEAINDDAPTDLYQDGGNKGATPNKRQSRAVHAPHTLTPPT